LWRNDPIGSLSWWSFGILLLLCRERRGRFQPSGYLHRIYYQYFCGEPAFRHELPFDRSSMSRWRARLGEENLAALLQESLSVAHKTGALETKDLERVVVDTTVQPKAVAHPSDARLMYRAIAKLVALAKREDVVLRQSYLRVAKRAALMVGCYTHAHQFKRARRKLKFFRTRLGLRKEWRGVKLQEVRRQSPRSTFTRRGVRKSGR